MSYYMALPGNLLEELLAYLPPDERPFYAERFEPIACDLIWVADDANNAITAALAECIHPWARLWEQSPTQRQELLNALMARENEPLIQTVQNALQAMASELISEHLQTMECGSEPAFLPEETKEKPSV